MNKIKVVHIITKLELGGAQGNTLYTVENLDKEKFDVYLVCGKGGILDKKAVNLSKRQNIKLYFVDTLVREINFIKDFLALKDLLFILDEIKPDIIHTHSSKAGILGRIAGHILRLLDKNSLKIIHTFHGFGFNEYQKLFVKWFYIILEKFVARFSNILIFVSNANMETAQKYKIGSKEKYLLIRSGIKISLYQRTSLDEKLKQKTRQELNVSKQNIVITTIGPFKPQKNLSDFIKLCNNIMTSDKLEEKIKQRIIFLVAGDGEQRNQLEQLVGAFKLNTKIKFLSWYENIPGLISITDIFVMTSLWEGLPRAAVEALVSGVPVVSYNTDGLKDIIVSDINGYTAPAKKFNLLANYIVELLNNEKKLEQLKSNARKTINETFDIDYMVKQQEELYLTLIK